MKCILFRTPNQGWKIAFGSIGVQKTTTFDGFAKKLASQTSQIAAISNRAISNRCDLGGLRFDFFSKTIDFHGFCYAYGSKHYVPTSIWDAKKYPFHAVVTFL